jgi:hypothetical protein
VHAFGEQRDRSAFVAEIDPVLKVAAIVTDRDEQE